MTLANRRLDGGTWFRGGGTHTFHDLPPCRETLLPVRLPLEQVSRVQSVAPELEDAAELAGRGGGPEAEFLHQARALGVDEGLELAVELGELGVVLDAVDGGVVAGVALVLPDVDCGGG